MLLTVAICTWNRAELLDVTLTEFHKLEIPPGVQWEILVVNNNCTDETDDVIRRHAGQLPIRRLFEPQAGLSNARNCAVSAARGELILWTDDDVLVDRRWLAEYAAAAAASPEASFFGGPVEPHFLTPPPSWLTAILPRLGLVYAVIDYGNKPFPFVRERTPIGANYAVRTDVQRRFPYDPKLGRTKSNLMSAEETCVMWQMLDEGLTGYWVPVARVRHCISADRQTFGYLRRYFRYQGKYAAMADRQLGENRDFRSLFWIFRQAVKTEIKYRVGRIFRDPEHWIHHLTQSSYHWGRLFG